MTKVLLGLTMAAGEGWEATVAMATASVTTNSMVAVTTSISVATSLNVVDRLLLLSPRTWWGFMVATSKNDMSEFDLPTLIQAALVNVATGIVFLWLLWMTASNSSSSAPILHLQQQPQKPSLSLQRLLQVVAVYFLSPWAVQASAEIIQQFQFLQESFIGLWQNRFYSRPEAVMELRTRLSTQRAYRRNRYIVFLPPPTSLSTTAPKDFIHPSSGTAAEKEGRASSSSSSLENGSPPPPSPPKQQKAVVFFPGFGVPLVAYSKIAARLSDLGILVVLVSMEPMRMATTNLGADVSRMIQIMNQVERRLHSESTLEWSLMGHSMGALCAMNMYPKLLRTHKQIQKLVLWGIAAFHTQTTSLANFTNLDILKVQATNDAVIKFRERYQDIFDTYFPTKSTQTIWIQNGTHDGFANYCPKDYVSEEVEGRHRRELQQKKACKLTADFLLQEF